MTIKILDMTTVPCSYHPYVRYKFSTSFPAAGVRVLKEGWSDANTAYVIGASAVREYKQRDVYGNMGEVIGVTQRDDGFHAVINLYQYP